MILTKGEITKFNSDTFLESFTSSEKLKYILIIVPTNRKARDLRKSIIKKNESTIVSDINIETLTTLCTKLLKENKSFIPLTEAASSVLLKTTAEELKLSYFAKYTKGIPFGTLDKIKNVISEYKRHGISPSLLENEAQNLEGGEKLKALDIAKIYKLYLDKCKSFSALEIGDIYNQVLMIDRAALENSFKYLFPYVCTVYMDGFDEFTQLEIKNIELASSIVDHNLIINFDYNQNNKNIFDHLTETYSNLSAKGFRKVSDNAPADESELKSVVRSKLFKNLNNNPNPKFKDIISKTVCNNRVKEIEFIARQIKLQLINGEVNPEEICVAFNLVQNYSGIVRDVFNKYGIPFNLSDRVPLKVTPPVIAVINLLELVENDFYFNDLVRVLSNGLLEFKEIDLNNLIDVANDLKIIGGFNNWENSVNDGIKILSYDSNLSDSKKNKIEKNYKKVLKDVNAIAKVCSPLKKRLNVNEFTTQLRKILFDLKLPINVLNKSKGKEEEFIKSLTVLLQTLNEVLLFNDKNEKFSTQYYLDQIRTISNWARFNIKEKSDYGVLITSINEIRGLKFNYLYLGGMCDGDFPTKYSPEIFFSGDFQKKEIIHQTEERYHLYQTLCTWEKKLFITVPQNSNDTELVESTFMKDLEALFEFNKAKMDENYILSDEELQIAVGSENIVALELDNKDLNTDLLIDKGKPSQQRRINPFDNKYSGLIGSEESIIHTLNYFTQKEFSASQLETFAKCPFKYFAEKILKIEPIQEPTDETEPIELGNILHAILYDFYSTVIIQKIPFGKVGSKEFNSVKELLFSIAKETIQKLNLNSPLAFFEKEKILGIDEQKENSILYKFLVQETESNETYIPKYFEYEFGNFIDGENEIPPLEIGDLKIRGKIDRIDLNENEKTFNILDYKLSGRKPTGSDLFNGISLQLPIYLMAGEIILKELKNDNYNGNKMFIYSLDYKDKNFGPTYVNVSNKRNPNAEEILKSNNELIENTKEKVDQYHLQIKDGNFHLSKLDNREEKVCRYCDFKSLCRVKEVLEV